jgi:hypothetical protein
MGEKLREALKLQFDKRLRLEFRGARVTSDAGLLACRELDAALGLTDRSSTYLRETRGGRKMQHELVPLLRQSVYSRLAGYEDTNDAVRLARDPAMQAVVGRRAVDTHGRSPWHLLFNKLCLTPSGRTCIPLRAEPVEPCPSGLGRASI